MPYFYDEETYKVIYKEHLYNAEALNGLISLLEDNASVYLLVHIPNKKFGWDVYISSEYFAAEGFSELQKLGDQSQIKKGQPYYALVPDFKLKEYVEANEGYEFKMQEPPKTSAPKPSVTSTVITNPDIAPIRREEDSKPAKEQQRALSRGRYKTSLHKDVTGEKPIQLIPR